MSQQQEFSDVLNSSHLVKNSTQVSKALYSIMGELQPRIGTMLNSGVPIVVMPVLTGGLYVASRLMSMIPYSIPFKLAHISSSRYGDSQLGSEIVISEPSIDITGCHVILVDDIFDEGITLNAVKDKVLRSGATNVTTVVLCHKAIGQYIINIMQPDIIGMSVPDKFLFGCGMDYKGFGRHIPDIMAVNHE